MVSRRNTKRAVRPYEGVSITPKGVRIWGGLRIGKYLRIDASKRVIRFR